jgi:hypothetical protein
MRSLYEGGSPMNTINIIKCPDSVKKPAEQPTPVVYVTNATFGNIEEEGEEYPFKDLDYSDLDC